jgi:hypothetical protein
MPREIYPWAAFAILLAVPGLATSDPNPTWLRRGTKALLAWTLLLAFAFAAISMGPWSKQDPISLGTVAVFCLPLIQAALILILAQAFHSVRGRMPVNLRTARWDKDTTGRPYWADRAFWLLWLLAVISAPEVLCLILGVQFPGRRGAS